MPGGEEVLVDWTLAFKDGPDCAVIFKIKKRIFQGLVLSKYLFYRKWNSW